MKPNILRGSRNLTFVLKIVLLQMFKIDWIIIIKFDTSNISFTNLIDQTCSKHNGTGQRQRFKARVIIQDHVFNKSCFSVYKVMLSHNRVWLLSYIHHSFTWMGHWKRKTPISAQWCTIEYTPLSLNKHPFLSAHLDTVAPWFSHLFPNKCSSGIHFWESGGFKHKNSG